MEKTMGKLKSVLALIMMTNLAFAHVDLDYPVGGETFTSGDTVLIEWHPRVVHTPNNWDIEYSGDGGSSWSILVEDIALTRESYSWVITQEETDEARIKIIQDNVGANYIAASGEFTILAATVNLIDEVQPISNYALEQNYPNPFNPVTTIPYSIPEQAEVTLTIFDVGGQEVLQQLQGPQVPGSYSFHWHGVDHSGQLVSTGVYFARLQAGNYSSTIKMVYLR